MAIFTGGYFNQKTRIVDGFRDPTSGLPTNTAGVEYVATASANGWTEDYLYYGDGSDWFETIPDKGHIIYSDEDLGLPALTDTQKDELIEVVTDVLIAKISIQHINDNIRAWLYLEPVQGNFELLQNGEIHFWINETEPGQLL